MRTSQESRMGGLQQQSPPPLAPARGSGSRRVLGALTVLALLAVAALAGWWAARATLQPAVASEGAVATEVVWAEALEGSVGRSLPLSTTLRQPAEVVAQNSVTGVVTQIHPGEVAQGEVAYVVGGTPVRVVEGAEPMWRDLSRGVKGADVQALQRLLVAEGHLDAVGDGDFGPNTERAVRSWQRAQGRSQTGVIPFGELISVPSLPAVIQLGENIRVGWQLAGGEDAVLAPTGRREFVLVVTSEQARLIPAEATVDVTYEEKNWTAVIGSSSQDQNMMTEFLLTAPDGGEVCGAHCGILPNDPQLTLRSQVVVVPRVSGTTVPAAALHTRADGTAYVVTDAGEVDVTIKGSGQGVAVVEGVPPGTRVQVVSGEAPAASGRPGTEQPTTERTRDPAGESTDGSGR